jgi:hypothetical protein
MKITMEWEEGGEQKQATVRCLSDYIDKERFDVINKLFDVAKKEFVAQYKDGKFANYEDGVVRHFLNKDISKTKIGGWHVNEHMELVPNDETNRKTAKADAILHGVEDEFEEKE